MDTIEYQRDIQQSDSLTGVVCLDRNDPKQSVGSQHDRRDIWWILRQQFLWYVGTGKSDEESIFYSAPISGLPTQWVGSEYLPSGSPLDSGHRKGG